MAVTTLSEALLESVATHPAFRHLRSHHIDNLNLWVHEFEHKVTGAMHFHLDMPHTENVFMVAFRTVPMDSTGVAHVLEHTVLCGSEKYPVRDPFFLMIRRSLNTFMNAFTSSDYTAYPFASQNKQDFNNLMDIYLDAVFFPRLHPLDFAQEGHRIEFEKPDDIDSELVYRGIVYNEMKGDASSPVSILYDQMKKHLFPTNTYHFNSGGDPADIPNLTYEGLLAFYRSHYHPSNAVFMTFGDIPAIEHQTQLESKALNRFEASDDVIAVTPEKPLHGIVRVSEPYAIEDGQLENRTHVVMGWKLGLNTDLALLLKCNLLSDVLLDTSASPLRKALENADFDGAPSPLCGLEETNLEMSFFCGMEGCNTADADKVEQLIIDTLKQVVVDNVSIEQLEACLHQLELSHREIGGDGYPYGLQLIFSCMSAAVHRSDPFDLLDLDRVIQSLREEIKQPDFLPELVRECLLDNEHCVRLTLYPDENFNKRQEQAEKDKLEAIKSSLSMDQKLELVKLAKELKERQDQEENIDVLPRVGLDDIPATLKIPSARKTNIKSGLQLTEYEAATNGLVYHQIVTDLPPLEPMTLENLQLFTQVITEIGSAGRPYLDTQQLQHSLTGGMSAYTAVRGRLDDPNQVSAHLTLSSRCLSRNTESMVSLLQETLQQPNFTEKGRIRDLIKQSRIRQESSIAGNGHGLAMSAAASYFRPVPGLNHHLGGLAGTQRLKQLDDQLDDEQALDGLLARFASLHEQLQAARKQLLIISEPGAIEATEAVIEHVWRGAEQGDRAHFEVPFSAHDQHQAWIATTQVNFCAEVFPTVPESHSDSAALAVLAGVLRNGYLHRVIREQGGAYGGGAMHDSGNGLFRFYSYRDPNLLDTFEAFAGARQWLATADITFSQVEEAILNLVSSIDAPGSPAGEARQAFHSELLGRSAEHRQKVRQNILATSIDDVKRVAATYLSGESAQAVVCNETNANLLPSNFRLERI